MSADPITIKLTTPLKSIDRDLTEVTLREPTGKDMVRSGYPLRITDDGVDVNAAPMHKLIGVCAGITPDAVDTMAIPDWNACCMAVMGFFSRAATPPASASSTSSAPGGGETLSNSSSA